MSRAALDESLARLDAALGTTPERPQLRLPHLPRGHPYPVASVISLLDGQGLDVSAANTSSPFADVSGFGETMLVPNGSFMVDITAPVPGGGGAAGDDHTIDVTATMLATAAPQTHNAQVLFSEFVRILVSGDSGGGGAGVWPEVRQYEELCGQQAQVLDKLLRKMTKQQRATSRINQVHHQVVGERDMWRLLRSLYVDRQHCSGGGDGGDDGDDAADGGSGGGNDGWLASDQTRVNSLYDSCKETRETQLVVDWLEQSAAEMLQQMSEHLEYFTDSHIAWEHTLRAVKASARGHGGGVGAVPSHLVSSLDPDAPLRQGKTLHDLDQEEERVLVKRVMACLRAGRVEEAQGKCGGSGHHWLAAALEGWRLHHDPNTVGDDPTHRHPVQGNPYRDVWKAAAWAASCDVRLPAHQRAVYGTLCGNLTAMLLVCGDGWQDLLWAHARALADQRVEERLRAAHAQAAAPRAMVPLPVDYPERRMNLRTVLTSVEKLCSEKELQQPYFIICKHLILDDMAGLLAVTTAWLKEGPSPHLLRALTHLTLVLRRIYRIVQPEHEDAANDVLHAYVKSAMERGDVEQVAWYTAMMPAVQQVPCYASFLLNITDPPQRRHALHLAHTVGLDTPAIAATVVSIIRLTPTGSSGGGGSGVGGGEGSLVGETTPSDRVKVSGLEWLLFHEDLRTEALIQGLSIARSFLIARKTGAANMLLDKLPSDTLTLVTGGDDVQEDLQLEAEAAVREYLCIKAFLSAQECFSDWFDHFHQQKPEPPAAPTPAPAGGTTTTAFSFTEQIAHEHATLQHQALLDKWQATLDRLTKSASERLYNVLLFPDGGWLVDPLPPPRPTSLHNTQDDDDDGGGLLRRGCSRLQHVSADLAAREPDRSHQLATLRSVCIPQVCSLLQSVLYSTGQHKECLQLADLVASEQHQLYTAFGSTEMHRFLVKMVEPARHLLDHDKDALGYPLH